LNPEHEREAKDLEAAANDGPGRRARVAAPPVLGAGGEGYRDAGQKEEERGAHAAKDDRAAELRGLTVGAARPAVQQVRLDHDEDGQPAQPI
jgi:hypothetical protein